MTVRVRADRRRVGAAGVGVALVIAGLVHVTASPASADALRPVPLRAESAGGVALAASNAADAGRATRPSGAVPETVDGRLDAISPTPLPEAAPVGVEIAGLGVAASVVPVGVDAAGEVAVPADPATAGWYRFGSVPGASVGSTVVVGHVDFGGEPGVFFRLAAIGTRGAINVVTADGVRHEYRVTTVGRVPKEGLAALGTFRTDGAPVLTLVTCGGAFDPGRRSYVDNVVVVAEPVE